MIKKISCVLLIFLPVFFFSGCWNYRGLDDLTIILGIAVDKDKSGKNYHITYETVDLSGPVKETGIVPRIIESEGQTIFEAFRNAKRKSRNKLYSGNLQVVIINNKVAKEEGISEIIDIFLRDAEPREFINVVISKEDTAQKLLNANEEMKRIVSLKIKKIIEEDQKITATTKNNELYQIYNYLNGEGASLVLPVFQSATNNNLETAEADGIAVFKDDKMIGYLSPEQTHYYLFAADQIKGGVLVVDTKDKTGIVSLEIADNKTKTSYAYQDGKIKIELNTDTRVYISEIQDGNENINEEQIEKIKTAAQKMLEENISKVIANVQTEFDSDIFEFGSMIYKKDPKLWKQINKDWDQLFKTIEVNVHSNIDIVNTAHMK